MEFVHKNDKGEVVKLPVRVKRAENHQDVYANGALGGALANYHFRIDFYKDEFPPAEYVVENNKVKDDSIVEVERKILTSVYVSMPFLKELRNWLDKQINAIEKEYGEIGLPKSQEDTETIEALPEAKEA
jgi:Protein of unknown function (DUF3467)